MSTRSLRSFLIFSVMLTSITSLAADKPALTHSRLAHTGHGTRRPKGPPVMQPRRQGEDVIVGITELGFYCAPAPELSVEADGEVLKMRVLPPTGAVTRCWGAHSLTIQVEALPKEITKVVLLDTKGEERASAELAIP